MSRFRGYGKRKGWAKRLAVLGVIALASFGGYTLYNNNQTEVENARAKVVKAAKKVRQAAQAAHGELKKK